VRGRFALGVVLVSASVAGCAALLLAVLGAFMYAF